LLYANEVRWGDKFETKILVSGPSVAFQTQQPLVYVNVLPHRAYAVLLNVFLNQPVPLGGGANSIGIVFSLQVGAGAANARLQKFLTFVNTDPIAKDIELTLPAKQLVITAAGSIEILAGLTTPMVVTVVAQAAPVYPHFEGAHE
jgi:hypothetical protein